MIANLIPLAQHMPSNIVGIFLQVLQKLLARNPAEPKFYLSLPYLSARLFTY